MSFFQNVSDSQFRGIWVIGDRQYSLDFDAPPNANRSNYQLSWTAGPWDLSASGILTINYAWDVDFKNYSSLAINVTGATAAATKAEEVVNLLNANAIFAEMFVASIYYDPNSQNAMGPLRVIITAKPGRIKPQIRVYISNTGAEAKLNFNARAPVVQLPSYMDRHTIANRFNFPDSSGQLNLLDPGGNPIDAAYITAAGFTPGSPKADWEFLQGRASGVFMFSKQTVDGSSRITEKIEYGAGAGVGSFARKTKYTYTGAKTAPDTIAEIPYVLVSGDLITP